MGALKGSIAIRRYAVTGKLPDDLRRKFAKGIRAHAFTPLDPHGDLETSSGWVSILDEDDTDLAPEKVFFGGHLRLALRTDVLRAPAAEVRRQTAVRVAEREAKEGRPLSRGEKRALKEEVARKLRQRAFPRVRTTDVVWDLDGRSLWLWSQAKAVNETFLDLFGKSFQLPLEIDGPGRWARALADEKTLARLEPTRELWAGFDGVRPLARFEEDV